MLQHIVKMPSLVLFVFLTLAVFLVAQAGKVRLLDYFNTMPVAFTLYTNAEFFYTDCKSVSKFTLLQQSLWIAAKTLSLYDGLT